MPKIDWDPNAGNGGGGSSRVPAGNYVCRITGADWRKSNFGGHELAVQVDVASGEFEGVFAGVSPEDAWKSCELTAGETSTKKLTRIIDAIADSNPSFDARAAFEQDRWGDFIGRGVGVAFGERERLGSDGKVYVSVKPVWALPSPDVLRGGAKVPDRYVPSEVAVAKEDGAEYAFASDAPGGAKEDGDGPGGAKEDGDGLPSKEAMAVGMSAKAPF